MKPLRAFLSGFAANFLPRGKAEARRHSRHAEGGIEDADTGDVPSTYLALLLILVFAATSCAESPNTLVDVPVPSPEPTLPAGCDPFAPPQWGVTPPAAAPQLAEWTRTGAPDSVIALTGSKLSSRFAVFGQNAAGTYTGTVTAQTLDGMKAALVLPAKLPANAEYMVWPINAAGYGSPAVINATEAWWIGPDAATRGATVSVYGRNLTQNATAKASHIYIQKEGERGVWATVTAANPYKVDFTVPADMADGDYEVWVHNGHGGTYGWSGPLDLVINDGMTWSSHVYNVKTYGAKGDGVTDDQAAIESAVEAAAKDPWSTVYLPAGTYMTSLGFNPPSKVRWMGDGATKTFIKANANFVKPAQWTSRAYCLLFDGSNNNIDIENLTLDANGNMNGYLGTMVYMRFDSDIRFSEVTLMAKGYEVGDFHGSTRLLLSGCNIVGEGVFFGAATEVQVNGCAVYGTNDANTLLSSWGGDSVSYTNTTGQDYDTTSADGWAQGRFIYGSSCWGSNRNIYIGNCTTKALGVRPAFGNQNTGEQLLWESGTMYSGTPLGASAESVTFAGNAFFSTAGLATGQFDAVISNGTGLGQHRQIVGCTGATIQVSPPWNVAPDGTSTVLIAGVVEHCAVYQNTLQGKSTYATQDTASVGIQPFGNGYDFIADGNTISQTRSGINLWCPSQTTVTPQSINACYFNYIANNSISHCLTGIAGISHAWSGWPASSPYPGISCLGNTVAGNTVSAMTDSGLLQQADTAPIGDQMDLNIFAHNGVSSSPIGLDTVSGGHVKNTVSYKNSLGAGGAVTQ
jgi:polygalacturonase